MKRPLFTIISLTLWLGSGLFLMHYSVQHKRTNWSNWKNICSIDEKFEDQDYQWEGTIGKWIDLDEDGHLARTNPFGEIELWDVRKQKRLWRRSGNLPIDGIQHAHRADYVGFYQDSVYCVEGNTVRGYNLQGDSIYDRSISGLDKVHAGQKGRILILSGSQSSVALDLHDHSIHHVEAISTLNPQLSIAHFSENSPRVVLANGGRPAIHDLSQRKIIYTHPQPSLPKSASPDLDAIQKNTFLRSATPTEMALSPDGEHLILIMGNHLLPNNPGTRATKIQCIHIDSKRVVWEHVEPFILDQPNITPGGNLLLRKWLEMDQEILTLKLTDGQLMHAQRYSDTVNQPFIPARTERLDQSRIFLDHNDKWILFTDPLPLIARLGQSSMLHPIYDNPNAVPFATFCSKNQWIATCSSSTVVHVYTHHGEFKQGYLTRLSGWICMFMWSAWSIIGFQLIRIIVEFYGFYSAPWLNWWGVLQSLHFGYSFTGLIAAQAGNLVAHPWDSYSAKFISLCLAFLLILYLGALFLQLRNPLAYLILIALTLAKAVGYLAILLITLTPLSLWKVEKQWSWWSTPLPSGEGLHLLYLGTILSGSLAVLLLLLHGFRKRHY